MNDRLLLARNLLRNSGTLYLHLDPRANYYGRILLDNILDKNNFINEIIWAYEKARYSENKFKENHETLLLYSKTDKYYLKIQYVPRKGETELTKSTGRHKVDYEGKISPDYWVDIPSFSTAMTANERSVKLLGIYFDTQKPEKLIRRVLETSSQKGDIILDFFLGSGTTTAVAHKLGRKWIGVEMGEHFWTVVLPRMKKVIAYDKSGISKEQDVKEIYNEKTAGGFFKYQVLEQYEDSLDNIELTENPKLQELFKDEYLLKYFLNFETKESPYLLNIDMLKNPFAYKLKVNLSEVGEPTEAVIDIPETFVYLLGLKVDKIKTRADNGRKYLFILGEKDSQSYAVVFREYNDEWTEDDFIKDKQFIKQELEPWQPSIVYVNGQCTLTSDFNGAQIEIRNIEDSFKKLMEGA